MIAASECLGFTDDDKIEVLEIALAAFRDHPDRALLLADLADFAAECPLCAAVR